MCCNKNKQIIVSQAKQKPLKVIVPVARKPVPVKKLSLTSNDREKYRV